jgi:hypothetical protein
MQANLEDSNAVTLTPTSLRIEGSCRYMSAFSPSTISIHIRRVPYFAALRLFLSGPPSSFHAIQQPRLIHYYHGHSRRHSLEGPRYHVRGVARRYSISMRSSFLQSATRWQRCTHHQHRISRAAEFQRLYSRNQHICWHSFRLFGQDMLRSCCFNSSHPDHMALYQA